LADDVCLHNCEINDDIDCDVPFYAPLFLLDRGRVTTVCE